MDDSVSDLSRLFKGRPITSDTLRHYAAFLEAAAKSLDAGALQVARNSGIVESAGECGELRLNLSIGPHSPRTLN